MWTSLYLRMEFIRRRFCDSVRMALTISQCSSVAAALRLLEQDFKGRNLKGFIACIAEHLEHSGSMTNTRAAAEELGSQAMRWLKKFDLVFKSRTSNACHCKIGGSEPHVDYNTLLDDLRRFYEAFRTPVTDCEINRFLGFTSPRGRAATLTRDESAQEQLAVKWLARYAETKRWITCTECQKIGDAVIALEQPPSWCLVHSDGSFNDLCRCCERDHMHVLSALGLQKAIAEEAIQASSSAEKEAGRTEAAKREEGQEPASEQPAAREKRDLPAPEGKVRGAGDKECR